MICLVAAITRFLLGFDEDAPGVLRGQFAMGPVADVLVTSAVPFGALLGSLVA